MIISVIFVLLFLAFLMGIILVPIHMYFNGGSGAPVMGNDH